MSHDQRIPWHVLLGQALADAPNGLAYRVSTEEELALRSQRLDVLIIEQRPSSASASVQHARLQEQRPDGVTGSGLNTATTSAPNIVARISRVALSAVGCRANGGRVQRCAH